MAGNQRKRTIPDMEVARMADEILEEKMQGLEARLMAALRGPPPPPPANDDREHNGGSGSRPSVPAADKGKQVAGLGGSAQHEMEILPDSAIRGSAGR